MWGPSEEEVGEGCRREVSRQVLAGSQLSAGDCLRFILDLPIMSWYPPKLHGPYSATISITKLISVCLFFPN